MEMDRKPRTSSVEGRTDLADKKIEQIKALIENRSALIKKTEDTLNMRKEALEKNIKILEQTEAKKARILAAKVKTKAHTLESNELDHFHALKAKLAEKGQSMEEFLKNL